MCSYPLARDIGPKKGLLGPMWLTKCSPSANFSDWRVFRSDCVYVWRASFICVTWLIPVCDMTRLLTCMCDMSHLYVWHAPWIVTWACFDHGLHLSWGVVRGGRFRGLNNSKRIESVSFWEREKKTGTAVRCDVSKCTAVGYSALQHGVGWCSRRSRALQDVSLFFKTWHAQFPPRGNLGSALHHFHDTVCKYYK